MNCQCGQRFFRLQIVENGCRSTALRLVGRVDRGQIIWEQFAAIESHKRCLVEKFSALSNSEACQDHLQTRREAYVMSPGIKLCLVCRSGGGELRRSKKPGKRAAQRLATVEKRGRGDTGTQRQTLGTMCLAASEGHCHRVVTCPRPAPGGSEFHCPPAPVPGAQAGWSHHLQ